MFQQNISTDDGIYSNHFRKRAMERGEGWVEVPSIPPGWECKQLRGFIGSITGRILKNLRATIFFRLLRFSLRASQLYSIYPPYSSFLVYATPVYRALRVS